MDDENKYKNRIMVFKPKMSFDTLKVELYLDRFVIYQSPQQPSTIFINDIESYSVTSAGMTKSILHVFGNGVELFSLKGQFSDDLLTFMKEVTDEYKLNGNKFTPQMIDDLKKRDQNVIFYKQSWVMWLSLLMFAPIGVYLLWSYGKHSKLTKIIITAIFLPAFLGALFDGQNNATKTNNDIARSNISNTAAKTFSSSIDVIKKCLNATDAQAKEIDNIFLSVGINSISNLQGSSDAAYVVNSPDLQEKTIAFAYIDENKTVNKIVYKGSTLYESGKVQDTISSGLLNSSEKRTAMDKAEREVKKALKDPSSAKFPGTYWVHKSNNIVSVVGYVNAKNSFGAMMKSKFFIDFDKKWNVVKLNIESMDY